MSDKKAAWFTRLGGLFIMLAALSACFSHHAAFAGWEVVEANKQLEEMNRIQKREAVKEALEKREAAVAKCDETYDACFDRAHKGLYSCGSAENCSQQYAKDKKVCLDAYEHCEKSME